MDPFMDPEMTREPTLKRTRLVSLTLKSAAALFVFIIVIAVGFALGVLVQSKPQWAILSTAASDEEFERRVADFLTDNPEVIADAFAAYAQRQGDSANMSQAPNLSAGLRRSAGDFASA